MRTKRVAAGVKLSLLVSAVADGPKRIALCGERIHEVKTLRIGPWIKDRILLIDLGFYKHHTFARIDENGGFFISRLKSKVDPLIVGTNRTCRGRSIDVVGKRLKSDNLDNIKKVTITIGMSVIRGAIATLIPASLFVLNVSEITRVRSGPGDIPAVSPKTIPDNKKVNISNINCLFYNWSCIPEGFVLMTGENR